MKYALIGLLVLAAGAAAASSATRNILVVIADDFGADSYAPSNTNASASLPPTPHLDALAARGVRFANAYAYPVCSPTRAAMLTGRYGFRTGVTGLLETVAEQGVYTNELTLPDLLAATHRSAAFGKWHLGGGATGPNVAGGWSHFAGSLAGALGVNATNFWRWTKVTDGVSVPNHLGYATTDNVNDALAWLARQGTNRWFLWLAFNAPHTPFHRPPPQLCPHYPALSGTAADIQENPRAYFEAAVEAMDTELGRLLAGVDLNETAVIFTGDNGTVPRVIQPPYNLAGRAKDTLYEGGVRVPFIIAGPGVAQPGRVSAEVVHVVDVFATVLALAGMDPDTTRPSGSPVDSRSLLPILQGGPFAPREAAVLMEDPSATPAGSQAGRAARLGPHKLIQWNSGAEEFYDLAADPLEATNLMNRPLTASQQAALDGLRARLAAWTNVPVVVGQGRSPDGFAAEAAWFAGAKLTLWRNPDLQTTSWSPVTGAIVEDRGSVVRLLDTEPPPGAAFYRVRQE